jgi:hypothetical protein
MPVLPSSVFVDPPASEPENEPIPEGLRRLVRKYDPVERDRRNHQLGKAGESFVVEVERRRLSEADRPDLARKVRWVAEEDTRSNALTSRAIASPTFPGELFVTCGSATVIYLRPRNCCHGSARVAVSVLSTYV